MFRTLLHVATDWPGHYPNGAATVAALIEAGGEVDGRFVGPHAETAHVEGAVFPELILVGVDEQGPLMVLEGHARQTAYALRPECLPPTVPVLVGYARGMVP